MVNYLYGNENERDRAFFGMWPKGLAPLQLVTPPVMRHPLSVMKSLHSGEWDRFANSTAPVLSGDLLRDFGEPKFETFDTGMRFGWNTYGARVEHLRDMGRVLTSKEDPMPTGVVRYVAKESKKYIAKGIQKQFGKNKTRIHKIGKK